MKTDDYTEGCVRHPSTQRTDSDMRAVKMDGYAEVCARPKKARKRARLQNAQINEQTPEESAKVQIERVLSQDKSAII